MDMNKRLRQAARKPNQATVEFAKRMKKQIDEKKAKEEATDPKMQYFKGYKKGADMTAEKFEEKLKSVSLGGDDN